MLPAAPLGIGSQSGAGQLTVSGGRSLDFAGYSGNVTAGTTFSVVTAQWIVPFVTCQPGLPPQQVVTFIQANVLSLGVRVACAKGSSAPSVIPFAYFPPVDSRPVALALKVSPGDPLFAVISINGATDSVNATLRDVSTSTSAEHVEVVSGAAATAQGFFIGVTRGSHALFRTTALANFTAFQFLACQLVVGINVIPISGAASLHRITMTDRSNNVMARTSALTGLGTTFTQSYVRST